MSRRDFFIGQALSALGGHKAIETRGIPWLAQHAIMLSDTIMAMEADSLLELPECPTWPLQFNSQLQMWCEPIYRDPCGCAWLANTHTQVSACPTHGYAEQLLLPL